METRASARYIRISARKARLVVDTIRGRDIEAARQILDFSDKAAARVVSKVLHSAVANAENNNGLAPDDLYVAKVYVDEGPTLKRFRPRAMGRATRINKRTCHITLILDEKEPEKVAPKRGRLRKAVTGRGKAAPAGEKATEEKVKAGEKEPAEEPAEGETEKAPEKTKAAKPAAGKKPAGKKPAGKKPAGKKPAAAKKPAAKKPAGKKPAAKKPAAGAKPGERKDATKAGGKKAAAPYEKKSED